MNDMYIIDRKEMRDEFVQPAKELVLSIVENEVDSSLGMGNPLLAARIREYFVKIRKAIGYDQDDDEVVPFVGRRFQYYPGVAEFIDSMNRFESMVWTEYMNEEMGIMLGIIKQWEDWEFIPTQPISEKTELDTSKAGEE